LPPAPKSTAEANSSPEALFWEKARAEEIAGLEEAGMWVETVLPKGRRSIDTNWVFKRKV
ncbi:unnamed protein product, partial [Discosporangium mesarthrocarpum]